MLMIQKLNDPDFFPERIAAMHQLLASFPHGEQLRITGSTPLGMLEDMTAGRVE